MGEADRQLQAQGAQVVRALIGASDIEYRARHDIAALRGELLDLVSDLPPGSRDQQTVRDVLDILAQITNAPPVCGNRRIIEIARALQAFRDR